MGIKTKIEYADSTVNPVPGCSGCELYSPDPEENHCYAATLCNRYAGLKGWPPSFTQPTHFPERLPKAIKWPDLTGTDRPNKPWLNGLPRTIFVDDLGDLFAPAAPDPWETLAPHLEDMANSPHVYLILTKWPHSMMAYVQAYLARGQDIGQNIFWGTTITSENSWHRLNPLLNPAVSVRRWVSLEPLLGKFRLGLRQRYCLPDWVVAGGESGPNARPAHPDWYRALRDECQEAGVPFFFKQWGAWVPSPWLIAHYGGFPGPELCIWPDGRTADTWSLWDDKEGVVLANPGKKKAGRILDGKEWSQVPSFPMETEPCG